DRLGDAANRFVAETSGAEQLLRAFLRAADDHPGLRARPFEGLLDFGPGGVRQLGGLMARLLEQAGCAGLGLPDLLRGLLLRLLHVLARLGLGRAHHLGPLALALVAVPVDVGLALLQLTLPAGDLLLGAAELCSRGVLSVALD